MWDDDWPQTETVTDEMVSKAVDAFERAGGYPDDHPYESVLHVKMRAALKAALG